MQLKKLLKEIKILLLQLQLLETMEDQLHGVREDWV
jgi:hypothetical protein